MTVTISHTAGRVLDELIAREVTRLSIQGMAARAYIDTKKAFTDEAHAYFQHGWGLPILDKIPAYSTKIADAWPLAERFRMSVESYQDGTGWMASWTAGEHCGTTLCHGDTAPLAICRLALELVRGEPKRWLTEG